MPPIGRERRRTDAYGRARRLLYGILLLAASPGAIAADGTADLGKYRSASTATAVTAGQALVATLQGLVMISTEEIVSPATPLFGHTGYPRMALDTVTARVYEGAESPRFRVAGDGRSLRDGMGFDLDVGTVGTFHLNLYSRRNANGDGRRSALKEDDDAPAPEPRWSIGGTLELVRTIDGDRFVAVVPELLIDLAGAETRYLPFQASLKHANWRSVAEKAAMDERVLQLTFQWRL